MSINLANATSVTPTKEFQGSFVGAEELTAIQNAGVNLARWVLVIAGIYVGFLITYMCIDLGKRQVSTELQGYLSDSLFSRRVQIINLQYEQIRDSKAFVKDMSQMVLLNVLFPILTAVLGYVFATKSNEAA